MASSAGGALPQFASDGDFDAYSDDDDEDDGAAVTTAAGEFEDRSMTSQDGDRLRPLPATSYKAGGTRGFDERQRQGQAVDLGRGRRAAVTQCVGKQNSSISVVEEERSTDEDPEDDDVLGGSSAGTSTVPADDGIPNDGIPHFVVSPRGARLRYHRTSLLGVPLNYRASRRDTRAKRFQSRVYNFLERPKTCPAITYHVTM